MKLLNYYDFYRPRLAIDCEKGIVDVVATAKAKHLHAPETVDDAILAGKAGLEVLKQVIEGEVITLDPAQLQHAPAVWAPGKILCVGLNYVEHDKEVQLDLPKEPVLFSKFSNALAAHGQAIALPALASQFDYEAELVIVIGKEARNVSEAEALNYVYGYTIGNDLSARDLQFRSGQWLLGKTCDGFGPIGPHVVTADEIDPNKLDISLKLNGETRQSANTADMIFSCATIISYASKYMTLKPGDIIFTGTPGGVITGRPEGQKDWLKPGDKLEATIQNIGTLVNTLR